jgi:hypothetical protein
MFWRFTVKLTAFALHAAYKLICFSPYPNPDKHQTQAAPPRRKVVYHINNTTAMRQLEVYIKLNN